MYSEIVSNLSFVNYIWDITLEAISKMSFGFSGMNFAVFDTG
jgi:hypothetical protein